MRNKWEHDRFGENARPAKRRTIAPEHQLTEKLADSLFALASFKSRFEPALNVFKRYPRDGDLHWTMQGYILILVCGFLEEWRIFRRMAKDNQEVLATCKVTSKCIKRIDGWSGHRAFRNSVLAHTTRSADEGGLTDVRSLIAAHGMPSYLETMLMAELAVICVSVAITRHGHIYEPAKAEYLDNNPLRGQSSEFGIRNRDEFLAEIDSYRNEMLELDSGLASILNYEAWPGDSPSITFTYGPT